MSGVPESHYADWSMHELALQNDHYGDVFWPEDDSIDKSGAWGRRDMV